MKNLNNLAVVRNSFANTVFTHKVHESAAERLYKGAVTVKILNIIFVAFVLILLTIQSLFPQLTILAYIGAGISAAEIIFLIIQLNFNFEGNALLHKNSALKYLGLRDKYKNLIADICDGNLKPQGIVTKRDMLQDEYQTICDLSPQTEPADYESAQIKLNKKGLTKGEEFTWTDEEIDRFLPKELRSNKLVSKK